MENITYLLVSDHCYRCRFAFRRWSSLWILLSSSWRQRVCVCVCVRLYWLWVIFSIIIQIYLNKSNVCESIDLYRVYFFAIFLIKCFVSVLFSCFRLKYHLYHNYNCICVILAEVTRGFKPNEWSLVLLLLVVVLLVLLLLFLGFFNTDFTGTPISL